MRDNTWVFILLNVLSVIVRCGQNSALCQFSVSCVVGSSMCVCLCMSACVADVNEIPPAMPTSSTLQKLPWVPPQEVPLWDITNCVLEDGQILICPEEEVPECTT